MPTDILEVLEVAELDTLYQTPLSMLLPPYLPLLILFMSSAPMASRLCAAPLDPRSSQALLLPGEPHKKSAAAVDRAVNAKRRRTMLGSRPSAMEILGGSLSLLEQKKVKVPVMADYTHRVAAFMTWCQRGNYDWDSHASLDALILVLCDEMFFKGLTSADGSKTLAAILFFVMAVPGVAAPQVPRSRRALQGWTKIAPNRQRMPIPFLVLLAIIGFHLFKRNVLSALNLLVQFRSYLRPGSCDRLRVWQLQAPNHAAGGKYSQWAILENPSEDQVAG